MAISPTVPGTTNTTTRYDTGTGQTTGQTGQSTGTGSTGYTGEAPPASAAAAASANAPLLLSQSSGNGNNNDGALAAANGALQVLADDSASVEDKLKALLSIVTDPDLLGKLMVEFANMGRQNALDSRLQALNAARGDLEAQEKDTRDAAIISLVVAVVVLLVSVASFAAATGGAKKGLSQSDEAANAQKAATDAAKSGASDASALQLRADNLAATAKNTMANTESINNLMQALVGFARAADQGTSQTINSLATVDQAEGQESAAKATEEQAMSDIAKKVVDDFEELVKSVRDFLRAMLEAEAEFAQIAARI